MVSSTSLHMILIVMMLGINRTLFKNSDGDDDNDDEEPSKSSVTGSNPVRKVFLPCQKSCSL